MITHRPSLSIHDVKARLLWTLLSSLVSIKRATEGKRRYIPTMLCQLRVNLWEANATNGIINGSDAAQLAVHLEHFLLCDIHEYRVYKLQLLKPQNRLDEHELQSAKRNLNDTLVSPMMKIRRPEEIAQIMDAWENESEYET